MSHMFDPEAVDLAALATQLRNLFAGAVEGPVVGRTRLRDAVAEHLACSQPDSERIVDTMVGRGFLVRRERPAGMVEWLIQVPE